MKMYAKGRHFEETRKKRQECTAFDVHKRQSLEIDPTAKMMFKFLTY